MVSLYDFQSALIDVDGNTHDVTNLFWKATLPQEIRAFLEKCLWVGKNDLLLKSSLETARETDEFLRTRGGLPWFFTTSLLDFSAQDTFDHVVTRTMDYDIRKLRDYISRSGRGRLNPTMVGESEENGYQALLQAKRYLSEVGPTLLTSKTFEDHMERLPTSLVADHRINCEDVDAIIVNGRGSRSQRPANLLLPANKLGDPLSPLRALRIHQTRDLSHGKKHPNPIMTFCDCSDWPSSLKLASVIQIVGGSGDTEMCMLLVGGV